MADIQYICDQNSGYGGNTEDQKEAKMKMYAKNVLFLDQFPVGDRGNKEC